MSGDGKSVKMMCFVAFVLTAFVFSSVESKSSRVTLPASSNPPVQGIEKDGNGNVFVAVAKSLASRALSEFQETARRNPRLGFNITMPMMLIPGLNNTNFTRPTFLDTTASLGLVGLKGGILGLKAAAIQGVVLVLFVVFLLTGIAYFACNIGIISCSNLGGSLGGAGGGLGSGLGGGLTNFGSGSFDQFSTINPFARNGFDYKNGLHRATSAVYNAIDDGQKKYT